MQMRLTYCLDLFEQVWVLLKQVATLHYVAKPVVTFKAISPNVFPAEWIEADFETGLILLGFIPFGRHHIVIEIPQPIADDKKVLIDNGYGALISEWKHTITLVKKSESHTMYSDEVMIRAGVLTPFVWTFAWLFYRWRKRNWFKLIQSRQ